MLFCPICNGPATTVGPCLTIRPVLRNFTEGTRILICQECGMASEIYRSGELADFPGLTLSHLYSPFPSQHMRHTTRSLKSSGLVKGES